MIFVTFELCIKHNRTFDCFSTIKGAGDGVFLKRDALKNTIVAFFNGIHITLDDTLRNEKMKQSVHKMWNDWDSDAMVYIPKEYISINAYNASLGMDFLHHFATNQKFYFLNAQLCQMNADRLSLYEVK